MDKSALQVNQALKNIKFRETFVDEIEKELYTAIKPFELRKWLHNVIFYSGKDCDYNTSVNTLLTIIPNIIIMSLVSKIDLRPNLAIADIPSFFGTSQYLIILEKATHDFSKVSDMSTYRKMVYIDAVEKLLTYILLDYYRVDKVAYFKMLNSIELFEDLK